MYLCVGRKGRSSELKEDTQQNIFYVTEFQHWLNLRSERKKRKKNIFDSGLNILNKMYLKITPGQWVLLEEIVVNHMGKRQF